MKNLMKIAGALLLVFAFSFNSNAQFKFSAGLDLGFVMEDGMGLAYGLAVGGEKGMGDNMGLTFQTGYDMIAVEGDGASASIIPLQAGFKYYFDSNEGGLYAHGQVGVTMYSVSYEFFGSKVSATETYLSYAAGAGYLINEKIDLGLRYNIISGDGGSLKYIALRAAYNF